MSDFIRLEGVKEALKVFDKRVVDSSARSAVNKLKGRVKTAASTQIRVNFNIKKADLDRKIETRLYTSGAVAEVSVGSNSSIGLLNFGATSLRGKSKVSRVKGVLTRTKLKRKSKGQQGVTAAIRKGNKFTLPNAFIAKGQRGRTGVDASNSQVFVRRSGGGLRSIRVISVTSMFGQEAVMKKMRQVVEDDFPKLFNHELDRRSK